MIGEQLKRLRDEFGLTQAQLGERLDVPANSIARWERGDVTPANVRMLWLALDQVRAIIERERRRPRGRPPKNKKDARAE